MSSIKTGSRAPWAADAIVVILGALLLCAPSLLLDGAPILFYDTTQYHALGQDLWSLVGLWAPAEAPVPVPAEPGAAAIDPTVPAEPRGGLTTILARSAFYSGAFTAVFETMGLWGVAAVQALLASALVWRFMRLAAPGAGIGGFAALMGALTALSALPVTATFLMPDIFAPVAIVGTVIVMLYRDRLRPIETAFWAACLLAAALSHTTHMLLILVTATVILLGWALRGRLDDRSAWAAAVPLGVIVAVTLINVAYVRVIEARLGAEPVAPPFLTARVLADGPGRVYLRTACPEAGYALCRHADKPLDDSDEILWSPDPARGVYIASPISERFALAQEQSRFVRSAVASDFWGQVRASFSNGVDQFAAIAVSGHVVSMFNALDNPDFQGAPTAAATLKLLDADCRADAAACIGPAVWRALGPVHMVTYWLALAIAAAAAWVLWRRSAKPAGEALAWGVSSRDDETFAIAVAAILLAMIFNAFVCGAASGTFERYQFRVAWLAPLAAGLFFLRRYGHSKADEAEGDVMVDAIEAPVKREMAERPSEPLELTILMPCLNEAETIETCVRKARGFLERTGVTGEVLVADNGSTDGSRELAEAAGARVVPIPRRGYGAALAGGIEAARSRFIVMGDADDSYDFENLEPMIERLRAGADLVMGNRFKGGIKPGAMPFLHKYLGNPVLSFLGRLFFQIPVGDFHCGLRGFNRGSIQSLGLSSPGMEFASEMVVKAKLAGLRMEEVPTTLSPDGRSRAPHLKTWRDGWRHLRFLLLHSPRWLFLYPGLILMGFGLVLATALAAGPLQVTPGITLDFHSLLVACFSVLIGAQLLLFSALARRYAEAEGFLPKARSFKGVMASLSLERMLIGAGLLLAAGLGGCVWAVSYWHAQDFGAIQYPLVLRVLIISLTAVATAIQVGAVAFLTSVLEIRR